MDDRYAGHAPDDDYDRGGAVGGSGGAILGVLMTLLIGSGLVFAAYKLGQRTSIDDPPLINANLGEAKMAPIDEGGTPIVNRDNDAYTMVDEIRRAASPTAEEDGVVLNDPLPDRALDPAGTLSVTVAQQDALRIDELQLASSVDGEPSLTSNDAPDRTGELELAGGAEVQIADSEAVLLAEQAASQARLGEAGAGADAGTGVGANAGVGTGLATGTGIGTGTVGSAGLGTAPTGAQTGAAESYAQEGTTDAQRAAAERDVAAIIGLPATGGSDAASGNASQTGTGSSAAAPLQRAPDTVVAARTPAAQPSEGLTEDDFGEGLVLFPLPRGKPDLAQIPGRTPRAAAPSRPSASRPAPSAQPPAAAAATTVVPVVVPVPVPGAPGQVPAPPGGQALQAAIPAQPAGDAQVQLGAMPTPDMARVRWRQLLAAHPDLLRGMGIQLQPVRTAQGQNLFRLRAGPLRDTQQAAQLCGQLRVRGVDCFVPAR